MASVLFLLCPKASLLMGEMAGLEGTHSPIVGLWNEKVDRYGLKRTPHDETDIRLPANPVKRNRPCELIEEICFSSQHSR